METATEWPYAKVLELIASFRQRPALWDIKCSDYKDRQKRHEATVELATRFDVEKDEIERKMKNLQSHFYREVKKEEQSKLLASGTASIYRSKWFAYHAMSFLADKNTPKRAEVAASKALIARWQKKIRDAARIPMMKAGDKSRRFSLRTRLKQPECKQEPDTSGTNGTSTDFLYVDMGHHNNLENNETDFWDEKSVDTTNQDPFEFPSEIATGETQQLQRTDDTGPSEKVPLSAINKQDFKAIPENVIAPTIDFLLAEAKAHDSNDLELNFYKSLIPDIMKLSDKKRRQFKEVVLCTLNKLLDEDEIDRAVTRT